MEDFPDDSDGKASVYNMGVGMLTCAGGGNKKIYEFHFPNKIVPIKKIKSHSNLGIWYFLFE